MRSRRGSVFRSILRLGTVGAGLLLLAAGASSPAQAQREERPAHPPIQPPTTQPGPEGYWLRVMAEGVYLRSRPDANSLPVARLERDAVLRATGSEFGWHRVLPPEGVFSFVAAHYVEQQSDGTGVVSVRSGTLRVRVGSLVFDTDPLQCEVQTRLPRGTTVRIVGRQDDWLKIVPPEGVYMYVSGRYAKRVGDEVAARLGAPGSPASQPGGITPATSRPTAEGEKQRQADGAPDLSGRWGQRLVLVEAAIEAEARKPVQEQSWTAAIASLRPVAAQREEPTVARLAAAWITRLEQRIVDQGASRAARELARREARNKAQTQRELERIQRAQQNPTSRPTFDARGTLLPSYVSGDEGASPRYRLVAPLTGRVQAYLEFPQPPGIDPQAYVGKYVGVRGERARQASLGADVIRVSEIVVLGRELPATRPSRRRPPE
jgi:hypothetical protein